MTFILPLNITTIDTSQINMKNFIKLSLCALLAIAFISQAQAADKKVDGTWSWTTPGRNGGPERKMALTLKTEGDKLTGKLESPGRDNKTNETAIQDGKVKDTEVTFTIVREFNGNKMTSKFSGKLEGDSIKGKTTSTRNGEDQSRDWEAKRVADKK